MSKKSNCRNKLKNHLYRWYAGLDRHNQSNNHVYRWYAGLDRRNESNNYVYRCCLSQYGSGVVNRILGIGSKTGSGPLEVRRTFRCQNIDRLIDRQYGPPFDIILSPKALVLLLEVQRTSPQRQIIDLHGKKAGQSALLNNTSVASGHSEHSWLCV